MDVHNLMEDVVTKAVNDLYKRIKKEKAEWLTCDCMNCRLDTISYVLNRIPPKYVVSGRGVTHTVAQTANSQTFADVEAIALEGAKIVSATKRPFHTNKRNECTIEANKKPSYNFPHFTGEILDGTTFEPVIGASILLKCDGEVAEMIDKTWMNPVTTWKSTHGSYSFWVKPFPAKQVGHTKTYKFTLEISAEGYEPTVNHFEISVKSENQNRTGIDTTISYKLSEILLFKKEE